MEVLLRALHQTLASDNAILREGEQQLTAMRSQPGFATALLTVARNDQVAVPVRQAAFVALKNFVKWSWANKEQLPQLDAERGQLKQHIVPLMLSAEERHRGILMDSVRTIAVHDWPDQWPDLLPSLLSQMDASNLSSLVGVLSTVHAVVRRFRHEFRSAQVMSELKLALTQLQQPLLALAQQVSTAVGQPGLAENVARSLVSSLVLVFRIFYDLNAIELPEFFEDNITTWMTVHLTFLAYSNSQLDDEEEEYEAGPVQKLQAAIFHNVELYGEKYEEEFQPFVPQFVQAAWSMLNSKSLSPKNDKVVTRAVRFLTAIAKSVNHSVFHDPTTLAMVVEKVVLPNVMFSSGDEEQFEDNPLEYIRRDIEGLDADTRRQACCELVKALCEHYEQGTTELTLRYIQQLLASFASNPKDNWKHKDAAIYLVTALAVRARTAASGTTKVSELVDVMSFLQSYILPELQTDVNANPVLKADAIKFVVTFRLQIPGTAYPVLMQMLTALLQSKNYVVYSYAANAIERLLVVREPQSQQPKIGREGIASLVGAMLSSMFAQLDHAGNLQAQYNEYLMKAIMRVVSVAQEDILPLAQVLVTKLNACIVMIAANPAFPMFSHYVFETLATVIRVFCKANADAVSQFEALLFPTFQELLQRDVQELAPYVFQIMSQLLEFNKPGQVGPAYAQLFMPLLAPVLWERQGNVPALVRLMHSYLHRCQDLVVSGLTGVLGVFQKLVASKMNDHNGFAVLQAVFEALPLDKFQQFLVEIFKILFIRLQNSKTPKFVRLLLQTMALLVVKHGGHVLQAALDALQPGLFRMIIGVWVGSVQSVSGTLERKMCAVAATKLLCETPAMLTPPNADAWPALLASTVKLFEAPEESQDDDDEFLEVEGTAGYSAAFSQLHNARASEIDPAADITNPKQFLALSVHALSKKVPGTLGPMIERDQTCAAVLKSYFQSTGAPAEAFVL